MQLKIPSSLGYGPQSLNVYGFDAQTKINVFYQLTLLSNNLKWYLLRITVFLIRVRGAENIEEKIKTDRRKPLINEVKEKRRIQGKSNNNNEHLWFYVFYKKLYFTQKLGSKK